MVNEILNDRLTNERTPNAWTDMDGNIETSAKTGTDRRSKRIKIYVTPATMNALEKNANRCGCSKMFICRLAWSCGHDTLKLLLKEHDQLQPLNLEKINTKKSVPLFVDIQPDMKKELSSDADRLRVSLSQYLRLLLNVYLKNIKVKE